MDWLLLLFVIKTVNAYEADDQTRIIAHAKMEWKMKNQLLHVCVNMKNCDLDWSNGGEITHYRGEIMNVCSVEIRFPRIIERFY